VNGFAAARIAGTAQSGTWRATVPVSLPVAPGSVLQFDAHVADAAGNSRDATLLVDNDGIAAALDRSRAGGLDQTHTHSNEFNNGITAGTLSRNGWTARLSAAPTSGGVRSTIAGAGSTSARVSACVGVAKEVRLDVVGETADVTCNPASGSITVKAVSAVPFVELREQLATGAWQQFNLPTGQSMTVGSPATASADNRQPIAVKLLQLDDAGRETVVGGYQLPPGASVDVSVSPGAQGREGHVRFTVLAGTAPVTVDGVARTIRRGESATMRFRRVE
jgi:hypothetical protein